MENKSREPLSNIHITIISGVIVWPLWLGLVCGIAIYIEEVLGYKEAYRGPDWIPNAVALAIFGMGFFAWRVVGNLIAARWGEPSEKPTDDDKQNTE
jgi:hypothetical protein